MGLLSLLKSVIGLSGSGSSTRSGATDSAGDDVDVTVEHEPATESEDAVKGTGDVEPPRGEPAVDSGTEPTPADEPDAAETGSESDAGAGETGGETGAGAADAGGTGDGTPAEPEPAVDVEGAEEPVETIKGIGPSYGERLEGIGVETVGDLVATGAEEVADRTDLSEKRVSRWIENARGE